MHLSKSRIVVKSTCRYNKDNHGGYMQTRRVSFDMPIEEHTRLKTACAQARIAVKDLMYEAALKALKDLKEKELHEMLKKSIQESKEGKGRVISFEELDEMFKDA